MLALIRTLRSLVRRPAPPARCTLCGEPPEGRPAAPDAMCCPVCGNPLSVLFPAA